MYKEKKIFIVVMFFLGLAIVYQGIILWFDIKKMIKVIKN
jgi:hypothetical protein